MRIALSALVLVALAAPARAHQSAVKTFELTVDGAAVDVRVEAAPGDVAEAVRPGAPTSGCPMRARSRRGRRRWPC